MSTPGSSLEASSVASYSGGSYASYEGSSMSGYSSSPAYSSVGPLYGVTAKDERKGGEVRDELLDKAKEDVKSHHHYRRNLHTAIITADMAFLTREAARQERRADRMMHFLVLVVLIQIALGIAYTYVAYHDDNITAMEMAPMAFVIFLAALTLGYGSSTRQRGWLILGTVMEMLVLTFANPFRSSLSRGLIVINILLMAVALAGAATTTIVSELFQVETVEHMILADDAGCGMPENTTEALAVYGGLLSPFLMAASVFFAFFAANAEYRPQQMAFGIAAAGSVIPITAGMVGLCLRVRAILIVTYFFTLLNTQACWEAVQQGVAAEDLDQSGVGLVGLFFSILYSWIIYRSSERIQEEKVYHFRATLNKLSGFFVVTSALQACGIGILLYFVVTQGDAVTEEQIFRSRSIKTLGIISAVAFGIGMFGFIRGSGSILIFFSLTQFFVAGLSLSFLFEFSIEPLSAFVPVEGAVNINGTWGLVTLLGNATAAGTSSGSFAFDSGSSAWEPYTGTILERYQPGANIFVILCALLMGPAALIASEIVQDNNEDQKSKTLIKRVRVVTDDLYEELANLPSSQSSASASSGGGGYGSSSVSGYGSSATGASSTESSAIDLFGLSPADLGVDLQPEGPRLAPGGQLLSRF